MRPLVILPLLLLAALATAACGATTTALAGGTRPAQTAGLGRAAQAATSRTGARAGPQVVGDAADSAPLRLVFVGASVTDGWYASTRDRTYAALVARGLSDGRAVRVRMLARAGITAEEAAHWNLAVPADVVVVQIATNDFVRDVPVDAYSAAYAELLDRLRTASPRAQLLCLGAWSDPASKNRIGVEALSYDAATRTQCDAAGGRYVDLSGVYLDPRNHGPAGRPTYLGPGDLFHPNDRGHAELAALILADEGVPEAQRPAA
jgi:acyl-CoA thioesterase I